MCWKSCWSSSDAKRLASHHNIIISFSSSCVLQGSFPRSDFTFKVYYPATRQVEDSRIADDWQTESVERGLFRIYGIMPVKFPGWPCGNAIHVQCQLSILVWSNMTAAQSFMLLKTWLYCPRCANMAWKQQSSVTSWENLFKSTSNLSWDGLQTMLEFGDVGFISRSQATNENL